MTVATTAKQLLLTPIAEQLSQPDRCLQWVQAVSDNYLGYDRHGGDTETLLDLKLSTIFWRHRVADELVYRPPAWQPQHPDRYQEVLAALGIYFDRQQQTALQSICSTDAFAALMAAQGVRANNNSADHDLAGPGVDLKISANRSSSWSFRKWRRNPVFGRYQFDGDGIRYRGLSIRPGDVLLTNVNLDGNGVYTSLSEPRGFSSHSAFFAILEHQRRRFPVAIETFEKGVRPVPLNVFLGPRFCAYSEVYRHRDLSPEHTAAVNVAAAEIVDHVQGYNFDSEDNDRRHMSCTSVGRFLHRDAGLTPARTMSGLNAPQVQQNLARLGYTFFKFFAPVDYLLNDRFHCIGWVDNNQIDRLLARELVDQEFRRQFSSRQIKPAQFPFPYKINRWGLGHIRRQTLIGRLIGMVEGFDDSNLPKGPDDLMAVITLAEKQIGKSIIATRRWLQPELKQLDHLDLGSLTNSAHAALGELLQLPWLPAE